MPQHDGGHEGVHPTLRALANERRRLILVVCQRHRAPISERDLASLVVASRKDKEVTAVVTEAREGMRLSLRHADLPTLADADLVEWVPDDGSVVPADHPVLREPLYRHLVTEPADDWDAVLASLAVRRRRVILSVLKGADEPLDVEQLARRVLTREREAGIQGPASDPDVLATLRHSHLPQLSEAGLVEYDSDRATVAYEGHPALPPALMRAVANVADGVGLLERLATRLDAVQERPDTRNEGFLSKIPL